MAEDHSQEPIKTYVLIGKNDPSEGQTEDFAPIAEMYSARGELVHIIRPKKGQSIYEAVQEIEPPANVILCAHGDDLIFEWNQKEAIGYYEFFSALPRKGILSVTIADCKGGSAEQLLNKAPAGTLVQTMSSQEGLTHNGLMYSFVEETKNVTNPVDLFLKILDNFDPQVYERAIKYSNTQNPQDPPDNPNPLVALPYIIGIGGEPPVRIDLNERMTRLSKDITTSKNENDWANSVNRVKQNFDTKHFRIDPQSPGEIKYSSVGSQEDLNKEIDVIAAKIRTGENIGKTGDAVKDAEELRIAYALTTSYLDTSGQIAALQKQQIEKMRYKEIIGDEQKAFDDIFGPKFDKAFGNGNVQLIRPNGVANADTLAMEQALHLQGTPEQKIAQLNRAQEAVYSIKELSALRSAMEAANHTGNPDSSTGTGGKGKNGLIAR